jgi:hypothetical protein
MTDGRQDGLTTARPMTTDEPTTADGPTATNGTTATDRPGTATTPAAQQQWTTDNGDATIGTTGAIDDGRYNGGLDNDGCDAGCNATTEAT